MSAGTALVKTQVSSTVSTSLGSSSDFWRLRISSRTQARNHHRGGRSAGPIRHSVGWHPEGGCEMKGTRAQMRETNQSPSRMAGGGILCGHHPRHGAHRLEPPSLEDRCERRRAVGRARSMEMQSFMLLSTDGLGPRLGRARSQNVQRRPQTFEDVCPASSDYSTMVEVLRNTSSGPFKAVARVQIPLGPPSKTAGQRGDWPRSFRFCR